MIEQLGITRLEAVSVVVSTIGIYLLLLILIRVLGQRSVANMSSFDFGAVVAVGAVLGRTALLQRPTLVSGVIALSTLFVMQGVLGFLGHYRRVDQLVNRPSVLLMAGSRILTENLRQTHIVEDELRQLLRLAGIRQLSEVASVILERNGRVSVIKAGEPVDPWLMADVEGSDLVLAPDSAWGTTS